MNGGVESNYGWEYFGIQILLVVKQFQDHMSDAEMAEALRNVADTLT